MKLGIIYKAVRKESGLIYIGQTSESIRRRINQHFRCDQTYFEHALRKYGYDAFEVTVIDTTSSREKLNELERYWIRFYDCIAPKGYNLTAGGEGMLDASEETKAKLSKISKGKTLTEDHKRKISESHKGQKKPWVAITAQKNKGKHLSPEHRAKIGESRKGKHLSEEAKRNISKGKMGNSSTKGMKLKPRSEEHCRKLSDAQKGKPRVHSESWKHNVAKAHQRQWADPEYRARKVIALSEGYRRWRETQDSIFEVTTA